MDRFTYKKQTIMSKAEELKTDINKILRGSTNSSIVLTATLVSVIMEKVEQYAQQVSRPLIEILKVAYCPNCDGSGAIPINTNPGDQDWEQCQWCYERELLLKEQEEKK